MCLSLDVRLHESGVEVVQGCREGTVSLGVCLCMGFAFAWELFLHGLVYLEPRA